MIAPRLFREIPFSNVKDMFEFYQRLCRIRRVSGKEFDKDSFMWLYCHPTKEHSVKWCLKMVKAYEKEYKITRSFFPFNRKVKDKSLRVYYRE